AGVNDLLHFPHAGIVEKCVAHENRALLLSRQLDQRESIGSGEGDWFLNQDVLARFKSGFGYFKVRGRGSCDDNCVNCWIAQQRVEILGDGDLRKLMMNAVELWFAQIARILHRY